MWATIVVLPLPPPACEFDGFHWLPLFRSGALSKKDAYRGFWKIFTIAERSTAGRSIGKTPSENSDYSSGVKHTR
jgi:hypothetical protein